MTTDTKLVFEQRPPFFPPRAPSTRVRLSEPIEVCAGQEVELRTSDRVYRLIADFTGWIGGFETSGDDLEIVKWEPKRSSGAKHE